MSQPLGIQTMRVFTRVAATGSLSRAAASLGIAQSAVSRHIAQAEAELGGVLFHRTGRGVVPTELAAGLLERARAVVEAMDGLLEEARDFGSLPGGTVRIGVLHGTSGTLPSRLYARVRERFPRVRLEMIEGHSGEIEEWIVGGHAAIGILARYRPGKWPGAQRLVTNPVCLVGRHGSAPKLPEKIGLRSMAGYPLVVPVRPNALRTRLDELAQRARVTLDIAVEASGNTTVKSLVCDHGLFAVMPFHACAADVRSGKLQASRIEERGLRASLLLLTSARRPATKAAREVARLVPALARELVSEGTWIESP